MPCRYSHTLTSQCWFDSNHPLVIVQTSILYTSVSPNFLLADFLWLRKITTDPHILAHVNTVCPYDKYPKWKSIFYVLLTVHPCIISQINPTRCSILFYIFIYFSSLNVSGIHVPIIRRKLLYYATLVFVTLYGWRLVCCLDWNCFTRRYPHRVTNTSVA
jgi:hypothetical protein